MKTGDFSETNAASDLKVGRCRQLIEFKKVSENWRSRSFLYQIFSKLYVLCFNRPRYQVSVYRTIGPLVKMRSGCSPPLLHLSSSTTGY